jgi:hypothetical protein
MGATLWSYEAPWYEDPNEALRVLKAQVVNEHYDLSALLRKRLAAARESVAITKEDSYFLRFQRISKN